MSPETRARLAADFRAQHGRGPKASELAKLVSASGEAQLDRLIRLVVLGADAYRDETAARRRARL